MPRLAVTFAAALLVSLATHDAASQAPAPARSPALQRLNEEAGRDSSAVDRFWTHVSAAGTPLVEPAPAAMDRHLVTFLFRSKADAEVRLQPHLGATVSNGVDRDYMGLGRFERLAGTDVYYVTFEVSNRLRFAYRIQVNGKAGLDPLNPRVFARNTDWAESLVELAKAPPQPWLNTEVKGKWTEHRVPSRVLGAPQAVWVYTPAGYDPAARERYPTLLGMDSVAYGLILPTARVTEYLAAQRAIRPTVIIAAPDLGPVGDKGSYDPAVTFLADELLPWARAQYRISPKPSEVVISGASRRGMLAAYAAFRRPDAFQRVLSLSGSFYWRPPQTEEFTWLPALVAREPKQPVRLYLAAGSLETVVSTTNAGHYLLGTNRHMRDVLGAKGYTFEYVEFYGLHSPGNWQDQLQPGLTYLLGAGRPREVGVNSRRAPARSGSIRPGSVK